MSYLKVPVYISFAHELTHALNLLEFLNNNDDVDDFLKLQDSSKNMDLINGFLNRKLIDLLQKSESKKELTGSDGRTCAI